MNIHSPICKNIDIRVEKITPDDAARMLEKNTKNRNIQDRHMKLLAREMVEGRFMFNGDAIRFDREGNLIDGQHRLWAIIESGVTIETLVIRNLDPELMSTIDGGKKRSSGDVLKLAGEQNTSLLGSSTRLVVAMAVDNLQLTVSSGEILQLVRLNPGLRRSASIGSSIKRVAPSIPVAIHYVGSVLQGMPETADAWLEVLITGVPAYDGCPVHLLRERLMDKGRWITETGLRASVDLHIHTWNNFVQKKRLRKTQAPTNKPVLAGLSLAALNIQR